MLHFDMFLASLPIMGKGMLGIFIVTVVITAVIFLLCKLFPERKEQTEKK